MPQLMEADSLEEAPPPEAMADPAESKPEPEVASNVKGLFKQVGRLHPHLVFVLCT